MKINMLENRMINSNKPLYALKIEAQRAFNTSNIERAKAACAAHDVDTHDTMGEAIDLFIKSNSFGEMSNARSEFHEAMHIASLRLSGLATSELVATIYEIALLREPFDGNIIETLAQKRPAYFNPYTMIANRRFNPIGDENYEKPVPPGKAEDALALAKTYMAAANARIEDPENKVFMEEAKMRQAYEDAVKIDEFFAALMGERRVYQLTENELSALPVAFFGIIKTGKPQDLSFEKIPAETRTSIMDSLKGRQQRAHTLENVKTAAELLELTQQ